MKNINKSNLKLAIFLLLLAFIAYGLRGMESYYKFHEEEYTVEYRGKITNRWTKSDDKGRPIYYIKLAPRNKSLKDYTTTVDEENFKKLKVGSNVKLLNSVDKKECVKDYKETEEENIVNSKIGDYTLIICFSTIFLFIFMIYIFFDS